MRVCVDKSLKAVQFAPTNQGQNCSSSGKIVAQILKKPGEDFADSLGSAMINPAPPLGIESKPRPRI